MVKQLIYDSCMIVEMRTIIAVYLDIQPSHKKHDGMMVVSKSSSCISPIKAIRNLFFQTSIRLFFYFYHEIETQTIGSQPGSYVRLHKR